MSPDIKALTLNPDDGKDDQPLDTDVISQIVGKESPLKGKNLT